MVKAYMGKENYIFLSYSHKDKDFIDVFLKSLNNRGCRIWYDEGIAPADEWAETIASRIVNASMVLVVISENSIQSINVKKEISFAISKNLPLIIFYKDKVELSLGLQMQLEMYQAINAYENPVQSFKRLISFLPGNVFDYVENLDLESIEIDFQKDLILGYYKSKTDEIPTLATIQKEFNLNNNQALKVYFYIKEKLGGNENKPRTAEDLKIFALKEIVVKNIASVSFLQIKLKIGYNLASSIINLLEQEGYIERVESKTLIKYKVKITKQQFYEKFPEWNN